MKIKNKIKFFILILLLCFFFAKKNIAGDKAGLTSGLFLRIFPTAHDAGLAGSLTSINAGITALFSHYKIQDGIDKDEFIFSHIDYIQDLKYKFLAYNKNIKSINSIIGCNLKILDGGKFKHTLLKTGTTFENFGYVSAKDYSAGISIAKKINKNYKLGLNVNFISSKLYTYKAKTLAVDIGFIYTNNNKISPISLGLSIQNLGGKLKYDKEKNKLPTSVIIGGSTRYLLGKSIFMNASIDVKKIVEEGVTIALGAELDFHKKYFIRGGFDGNNDNDLGLTMGAGIKLHKISFDYAFVSYGNLDSAHFLTFKLITKKYSNKIKKKNINSIQKKVTTSNNEASINTTNVKYENCSDANRKGLLKKEKNKNMDTDNIIFKSFIDNTKKIISDADILSKKKTRIIHANIKKTISSDNNGKTEIIKLLNKSQMIKKDDLTGSTKSWNDSSTIQDTSNNTIKIIILSDTKQKSKSETSSIKIAEWTPTHTDIPKKDESKTEEASSDTFNPEKYTLIRFHYYNYKTNKTYIKDSKFEINELKKLIRALASSPGRIIVIQSHSDFNEDSSSEFKNTISEFRAVRAKQFLIEKFKISEQKIYIRFFGDSKPQTNGKTSYEKFINRRTDFFIGLPKK